MEVLDQKRQALLREQQRLAETLATAEGEWHERAREASTWLRRASLLGGERPLRIARAHASEEAHVQLVWRNTLGVLHPEDVRVALPAAEALPPGGTSALAHAVAAHRRALEAAASFGAARVAHELVMAELRRTTRRLRAIERRWLPAHERALAELELALDEGEREDSARIRWAVRRLDDSGRDARGVSRSGTHPAA
jgi:vacuolar-type H+-ATPase subunit D/Vma8